MSNAASTSANKDSKSHPSTLATPMKFNLEPGKTYTRHRRSSVAATPPQLAPPNTFLINGKKYMSVKELGAGASSEVFKVLHTSSSQEFAVKCVNLKKCNREMKQNYLNEVELLHKLRNSDRVIKLYDHEHDSPNQSLRLVMETGETDLECFLEAHPYGAPPALVLHYWEEILHAVDQIHQHRIVHTDLKPANILLVSGRLKLIDFGLSTTVPAGATRVLRTQVMGTPDYISPEAVGGRRKPCEVSFHSDVWSLGCILYKMIYGHTPFSHLHPLIRLGQIANPKKNKIKYFSVDCIPPSLMAALQSCLRYDAHSRPTVSQLLEMNHLKYCVSPEDYMSLQRDKIATETEKDAGTSRKEQAATPAKGKVLARKSKIATETELDAGASRKQQAATPAKGRVLTRKSKGKPTTIRKQKPVCGACDKTFKTRSGLACHLRGRAHARKIEPVPAE